jgi:hypothetical protein
MSTLKRPGVSGEGFCFLAAAASAHGILSGNSLGYASQNPATRPPGRFPILSGGYERELAELRKLAAQ